MTVKNFTDYTTPYKEEYGFEYENTGDLSGESLDKLWEMLEEEL